MPTATMLEFSYVGADSNGQKVPVPDFPIAVQTAAISGTVVPLTLDLNTTFVRITSDTACLVRPDTDPVAADGFSVPVSSDSTRFEFSVLNPKGAKKYTTIRFKDTA